MEFRDWKQTSLFLPVCNKQVHHKQQKMYMHVINKVSLFFYKMCIGGVKFFYQELKNKSICVHTL